MSLIQRSILSAVLLLSVQDIAAAPTKTSRPAFQSELDVWRYSEEWKEHHPKEVAKLPDKAKSSAYLMLNGVTALSEEEAFIIGNMEASVLYLNDLKALDEETAKKLVTFQGQELYLDSLRSLDPAVAALLTTFPKNYTYTIDPSLDKLDPQLIDWLRGFEGEFALGLTSQQRWGHK